MSETVLTWNVQNWVTVVLMVLIGYAILRIGVTALGGNN